MNSVRNKRSLPVSEAAESLQSQSLVTRTKGAVLHTVALSLVLVTTPSFSATDYMATIGTTIGTGLTLGLNIVRALVFLIMVWSILTKYAEANRGRATWGEVFLPFIIGAVVLGFLAVIGPDADTAIQAVGAGG